MLLNRDPKHAEWVKGYAALLEEMRKYIMEYHTTGLTWNPNVISLNISPDLLLTSLHRVWTLRNSRPLRVHQLRLHLDHLLPHLHRLPQLSHHRLPLVRLPQAQPEASVPFLNS